MVFREFFHSWPGHFLVQSFVHSLVAAVVVEIAIKAWRIRNPLNRQTLLFIVVVLPVFSFPLFQAVFPGRGSIDFRLDALFDSGRWLDIDLLGVVPGGAALLALSALTAFVFVFQELLPIARHAVAGKGPVQAAAKATDHPGIRRAADGLPAGTAEIYLVEEETPVLFSSTGRSGSVFVSSGLLRVLDEEQLRAALAHEFAHVIRGRRPLIVVIYLLRAVLFFNPVVLLEFRRIVQEDEKICDDMAVSMTKRPDALARVLRTLYGAADDPGDPPAEGGKRSLEDLELYSQRLNIGSRIVRLEADGSPAEGRERLATAAAAVAALAINYFVV